MELNWLESLWYGIVSGLTEFLPVSSLAHQTVLLKVMGLENPAVLRFSVHLGAWLGAVVMNYPLLKRLARERRLMASPKKKRRRNPDFGIMMELRVLRTATAVLLLSFLGYGFVSALYQRLWLLAVFIGINGFLLYLPQYLPGANKRAQSLSGLDAALIGLGAGLGTVPGISGVGGALFVGLTRGADRRYAVDLVFLLTIPALLVFLVLEGLAVAVSGITVTGMLVLNCITAGAAAFLSGCWAMVLVRFLAVKIGFSCFAYYCWGLALFTLILYLI